MCLVSVHMCVYTLVFYFADFFCFASSCIHFPVGDKMSLTLWLIQLYCVHVPHFSYALIHQWASRPVFVYYEHVTVNIRVCVYISVECWIRVLQNIPRSAIVGSQIKNMTKIIIWKKERDKRQKIEVLKQIFPGSSKTGVRLVDARLGQQVDSWILSFLQSVLVLSL